MRKQHFSVGAAGGGARWLILYFILLHRRVVWSAGLTEGLGPVKGSERKDKGGYSFLDFSLIFAVSCEILDIFETIWEV